MIVLYITIDFEVHCDLRSESEHLSDGILSEGLPIPHRHIHVVGLPLPAQRLRQGVRLLQRDLAQRRAAADRLVPLTALGRA